MRLFTRARAMLAPGLVPTVSVLILAVVGLSAIFASALAPYSQDENNLTGRFAAPSVEHWLGTDELGRDILSRLMFGAQVSLFVSITAVALAAIVGVVLGGIAAVGPAWLQSTILRLADILLGFPEILMAIVLMAILGPSILNVVLAVGIAYAPRFIRLTWSSLLVIREQTYVEAARAAGTGTAVILFRHMLPNILPVLLVQITLSLGNVVLVESALSFLGLGVQPPQASWGSMINSAQLYISQSPFPVLFPGLAIMITVLALNFLGDALAEAGDPRLRTRAGDSNDLVTPAVATIAVSAAIGARADSNGQGDA